jgi:hypothetical protein
MSMSLEFYIARADDSAKEALAATLDNVRDRALRSEAAWRSMAERQLRVESERKVAERVRQERREAEAEAGVEAFADD